MVPDSNYRVKIFKKLTLGSQKLKYQAESENMKTTKKLLQVKNFKTNNGVSN